jgi:hypothetical protein
MNHAKTSFSTEMFAGAIISMVQYLVQLQFADFQIKQVESGSVSGGIRILLRGDLNA